MRRVTGTGPVLRAKQLPRRCVVVEDCARNPLQSAFEHLTEEGRSTLVRCVYRRDGSERVTRDRETTGPYEREPKEWQRRTKNLPRFQRLWHDNGWCFREE